MGLSRAELREMITEKANVIADSLGLELWGVEVLDGPRPLARIYVEKAAMAEADDAALQDGAAMAASGAKDSMEDEDAPLLPEAVNVDDCAHLSRLLGLSLEVDDVFSGAWVLEVSSPGLERVFFKPAQMLPYVGREIAASLRDPHPDFGDRRKFQGQLCQVGEESFTLHLNDGSGDCAIAWEAVRKAHLIHIFPDTSKPGPGSAKKARNTGQAGGNS